MRLIRLSRINKNVLSLGQENRIRRCVSPLKIQLWAYQLHIHMAYSIFNILVKRFLLSFFSGCRDKRYDDSDKLSSLIWFKNQIIKDTESKADKKNE